MTRKKRNLSWAAPNFPRGSPKRDPEHAASDREFNVLTLLPLPLLVARIRCADHVDHPVTAHDLAVLADLLDRRTYFHFMRSAQPFQPDAEDRTGAILRRCAPTKT
jgi:hypothetical protein